MPPTTKFIFVSMSAPSNAGSSPSPEFPRSPAHETTFASHEVPDGAEVPDEAMFASPYGIHDVAEVASGSHGSTPNVHELGSK